MHIFKTLLETDVLPVLASTVNEDTKANLCTYKHTNVNYNIECIIIYVYIYIYSTMYP